MLERARLAEAFRLIELHVLHHEKRAGTERRHPPIDRATKVRNDVADVMDRPEQRPCGVFAVSHPDSLSSLGGQHTLGNGRCPAERATSCRVSRLTGF